MNCKQGDIAIVFKAPPDHMQYQDKIVTCVEWFGMHPLDYFGVCPFKDYWLVDCGPRVLISDSILRPLRDSDKQDEMLCITGLPKAKEKEKVYILK